MFWVNSFYLKSDMSSAYRQWLLSREAKSLTAFVEQELGIKYEGTYWTVNGFGDFDCEEWWQIPDWATIDKARESKANEKRDLRIAEQHFMDETRAAGRPRVLRTTEDSKCWSPPELSEP
jgi:hypothetical protein